MTEPSNEPVEESTANETSESAEVSDNQDGASLTGAKIAEDPSDKITESAPDFETSPKDEYAFDARLYTEDGKFNKDGAKEFLDELKEKEEKYEKRILDLRRKVSDGKAIEDKEKIFQDFAPANEKHMKYFDETTPENIKQEIKSITDKLAERYYDSALTQRQADDITNTVLDVMESVGLLDTRTEEDKYIARQEWIKTQKQALGANADNIIRASRNFVENTHMFDAKTKNTLIELMESVGAPVISAIHQIADSKAGNIPVNVSNLGGLKSDVELYEEYMRPDTGELRRQEIINQRAAAGRTGRLSEITNNL